MWFNFAHLFCVSLLPLSTAWMALSELVPLPTLTLRRSRWPNGAEVERSLNVLVRTAERESPRAQLGDVGGDARSSHCGQAANDQRNSLGSASSGSKLTGLLQGILTLNSFGPTCRIGWRWPEALQPVERIFDTPMQLIEGLLKLNGCFLLQRT
jgi:hypothetical protein